MRVLSVAYPFAPVRADTPGGAEQVLLALDRALVRSGHKSFVVAQQSSRICGELLPVPDLTGRIDKETAAFMRQSCRAAIRKALRDLEIDLVHMHGFDFHEYMPPDGVPVLVTLHLPLAWYPATALRPRRPRTFFNCVSRSQMRLLPDGAAPTNLQLSESLGAILSMKYSSCAAYLNTAPARMNGTRAFEAASIAI